MTMPNAHITDDAGQVSLQIDGLPFPYALDPNEQVVATMRAGQPSTVLVPILCDGVFVERKLPGGRGDVRLMARTAQPAEFGPTIDQAAPMVEVELDPLPPKWSAPLSTYPRSTQPTEETEK